jgi:hypothetical protein
MRGDVLEAWGNGGKVLEAVVCDTPMCNVQGVTATVTDLYVVVSTARNDTGSTDSEIWRYPIDGGPATSSYRRDGLYINSISATSNGDLYFVESPVGDRVQTIRRLRAGTATDMASGQINYLSAARSGATVAYSVMNFSAPNVFANEVWTLDATTAEKRQLATDDTIGSAVVVSADGRALLYHDDVSTPNGKMAVRTLANDTVTHEPGWTGCLTADGTAITWLYESSGTVVYRGAKSRSIAMLPGDAACRPDGALVGLAEPKASAASTAGVAAEGDNGSMEHVCGVGSASGDLAVFRADGTMTRLGHDYHRIFQL